MPAEKINFYKIQQQHDMCSFIITIRVDCINTFCDYQSIETKHRQLSEVSQRRTTSRLLFNNMQSRNSTQ